MLTTNESLFLSHIFEIIPKILGKNCENNLQYLSNDIVTIMFCQGADETLSVPSNKENPTNNQQIYYNLDLVFSTSNPSRWKTIQSSTRLCSWHSSHNFHSTFERFSIVYHLWRALPHTRASPRSTIPQIYIHTPPSQRYSASEHSLYKRTVARIRTYK